MRIVTSGTPYIDIDAYAGIIAYAEFINVQGQAAKAVSTSPINESVSRTVRSWKAPLETAHKAAVGDTFTVIDVSDPDYFDNIVALESVDEVIDHHPGREKEWEQRIGAGSDIQFVGAACTLVYERWERAGLLGRISDTSAKLLATGILDNTFNFRAHITTPRDKLAYAALAKHSGLSPDWPAQYFAEVQEAILADLPAAIIGDAKTLSFASLNHPIYLGQLVVWDAAQILSGQIETIGYTLSTGNKPWLMNVVSIVEAKSYFICMDSALQTWANDLLGVTFAKNVAPAPRLWLRKEIIKRDLERL